METSQGPGWKCEPHTTLGWRGPGRKHDMCTQITLQGLRVLIALGDDEDSLLPIARAALSGWQNRMSAKHYLFGHGYEFKTIKWPPTWYDAQMILDTLGRLPSLFEEAEARAALAEIAACLVAYDFDADGRVTPRPVFRGFTSASWGQKKRPSAVATARLCAVLRNLSPLARDIAAVDVLGFPSTRKRAEGAARPPR